MALPIPEPQVEMHTMMVLVTPEMCTEWLNRNGRNRPRTAARVRYFEEELRTGRARTTHQGMSIDVSGDLQDGQHRAQAIINTGIPWLMPVTYNAPVENFNVIDRGGSRSLSDLMSIRGYGDKHSISIATLALQWERGQVSFRPTPRDDELFEFVTRWRDVLDSGVAKITQAEIAPPRQLSFVNLMAASQQFMDDLLDPEIDVMRPGGMLSSLWRARRKNKQHVDLKLELAMFVKARNDHQRNAAPDKKYGLRQAEAFPIPEWAVPIPFDSRAVDDE